MRPFLFPYTPTTGFTKPIMKTYMLHSRKVETHNKAQDDKLEVIFPIIKDAGDYMIFNEEARQALGNWRSPFHDCFMYALTRDDTEPTEAQEAADYGTDIDAWMVALVKLEGMLYDQANRLL